MYAHSCCRRVNVSSEVPNIPASPPVLSHPFDAVMKGGRALVGPIDPQEVQVHRLGLLHESTCQHKIRSEI